MSNNESQVLVLFNIKHPYDRKIVDGILDAMHNSNRNLQLTFMTHDEALLVAHDRVWDAVIADFDRQPNIELCATLNAPVVALVSNQHNIPDLHLPQLSFLALDTEKLCTLARDHLIACGVIRFGFFAGMADEIGFWAAERRDIFKRLVLDAGYEWLGDFVTQNIRPFLAAGLPSKTGFLGASDTQARQLITLALNLGINVPGTTAIIGIDNDDIENQLSPVPISTVTIDPHVLGERAFKALLTLNNSTYMEVQLIEPGAVINRLSAYLDISDDPLVTNALKYIYRHYHRPIKAEQVIAECQTSRNTLESHFKKALGKTIHQALHDIRMEKAKDLLINSNKSIEDVALHCGLSSAQYLYYLFRKEEGVTPKQFRESR
jgi:LacI family transcriptional regulator